MQKKDKKVWAFLVFYTGQKQRKKAIISFCAGDRFWVTQTKCEEMGDVI